MQTDKIRVNSKGEGTGEALDEVSRFANYLGLDKKSALRIRLLAEETLGMLHSITQDFDASFWMEGTKEHACEIHLVADTSMNYEKKIELIEASSSKKNAAAKGIMGKIRELIENGLYSIYRQEQLSDMYTGMPFMFGTMGVADIENAAMNSCVTLWSLEKYKQGLGEAMKADEAAEEAWDELEKSIVANLADDIKVAISGDKVELVIEKKI